MNVREIEIYSAYIRYTYIYIYIKNCECQMSKEEPLQSVFYNAVVLSELTNAPPAVNTNKHNTK